MTEPVNGEGVSFNFLYVFTYRSAVMNKTLDSDAANMLPSSVI